VTLTEFLNRRFWVVYPLWIVFCALLFLALRDVEDPSRPGDRIHNDEAGRLAMAALREVDPHRYAEYTVVNVAYARREETGSPSRWVVLADRLPRTALRQAVVVELDASSGAVISIRGVKDQ
jgi:hypothetical protein